MYCRMTKYGRKKSAAVFNREYENALGVKQRNSNAFNGLDLTC